MTTSQDKYEDHTDGNLAEELQGEPGEVSKMQMNRIRAVLLAIVIVGGLGAATVMSRGAFVMGFFFVFWGGAAALITWVASGNWTSECDNDLAPQDISKAEDRPFFDETGVHRFHGDVLDVENHPTAGAQGRM